MTQIPEWKKPEDVDLDMTAGQIMLGRSRHWVHEDYNPHGVRECFADGAGMWFSPVWNNEQDCYETDADSKPELISGIGIPVFPAAPADSPDVQMPEEALLNAGADMHSMNPGEEDGWSKKRPTSTGIYDLRKKHTDLHSQGRWPLYTYVTLHVFIGGGVLSAFNGNECYAIEKFEGEWRPTKRGGPKVYTTQNNIGDAHYVVNSQNGYATHSDGSPFWDIHVTGNKRVHERHIKKLEAAGYTEA